jgi:glycosyltransferase involved in cell wall biosynthesis
LPGRISRYKGHVDFMHLVGALIHDFPNIHGLFVGGGRVGSRFQLELEALAEKTGIGDRITFTGCRLDIRDWMSASEVVFNLSNDPPEAFGRTVLESLCMGRPVIAWNHGGASEILAAMFPQGAVEPQDFQQLEARVREFLFNQPAVQRSNAFGLETSMSKHLAVYQDLMMEQPQ